MYTATLLRAALAAAVAEGDVDLVAELTAALSRLGAS
jgi:hypothetical protein